MSPEPESSPEVTVMGREEISGPGGGPRQTLKEAVFVYLCECVRVLHSGLVSVAKSVKDIKMNGNANMVFLPSRSLCIV